MGETFTGKFVLDTSDAENAVHSIDSKVKRTNQDIEHSKIKWRAAYETMMHMANIWANYIAQTAENSALQARYQALQQGLQIASAEMSIGMQVKQAIGNFMTGTPWGIALGTAQLGLASSMQYILIQMQWQKNQMEMQAAAQAQAAAYFKSYGPGEYFV